MFLFIASFLCTPLMNDAKRINFVWGKQKSVKKRISPKYNFFSMVGPLYSHWQQCPLKNFLIKESFHRNCFRNTSFNYSDHFCAPLILYYKLFKSFLERKVFCEKKVLQKRNFLFYLRNSVLPLITMSKFF